MTTTLAPEHRTHALVTAPGSAPAPARAPERLEVAAGGAWHPVCGPGDLVPGRGVAALLPDGTQVALFTDRAGKAYAIGNRDPFTGAYVLSRGLTGSDAGRPFVASPLLKQRFDLATGRCLDDADVSVPVLPVRTSPVPAAASAAAPAA
ncbi:nitrite reductase small subunit NirD [Streptomyces sp. DSM 42041]|uniref:Nitrite reductase small subunit NirD n=1 Tax=Streptomyces hazeniae TaxID=3075538 RepID=A0ABU2NKE6_9ACTN|nr:nitrite reductase small subunit NirD [Streptomyces sp. DSM 42041]MDT0377398.1 nitrite reductase small subunit NirD [Streptomyces sp. DSM 42041]